MAGNHAAMSVNQDRVRPAEESDRIRDLAKLLLRMGARVLCIRLQEQDRHGFDCEFTNRQSFPSTQFASGESWLLATDEKICLGKKWTGISRVCGVGLTAP